MRWLFLWRYVMKKSLRKALCLALAVIMMVASCTVVSFGATGTKKMTAYTDCCKSGNYVYTVSMGGLYRYNIKTGALKRLVKINYPMYEGITGIRVKSGYVYYSYMGMEGSAAIYRIKTSGTSKKRLAEFYSGYDNVQWAISSGKIYYRGHKNYSCTKAFKKVMKLNGKSKKSTSYTAKTTYKINNAAKYYVIQRDVESVDEYGDEIYGYKEYLKLPSGGSVYLDTVWED